MNRLTVISLGGGVQSTVMALMAGDGAFGGVPDWAIFADTHWEPPTIYSHLEWLSRRLPFPLCYARRPCASSGRRYPAEKDRDRLGGRSRPYRRIGRDGR